MSGSVSLSATRSIVVKAVSSFVLTASFTAVGPSLTPLIVTVTVAVSLPPLPSEMV